MDSATVTNGDRFFLTNPLPNGAMSGGLDGVYGSNGAGRVVAIGQDVPVRFHHRNVGIYKSLHHSELAVGMWCEIAHVPYQSCLILPDSVEMRDYNGSFANILTVYAFFAQVAQHRHRAVIITAGNSATGMIAAVAAKQSNIPAIFLVRSSSARDFLVDNGVERVLVTTDADFEIQLQESATSLNATAVFDGVGGELLGRLIPRLPTGTTIFIYGFLGGSAHTTFPSSLILSRNITIRRFSNLESSTVRDPALLRAATEAIETMIGNPLLKTKIGQEFSVDQFDAAMSYKEEQGFRAVIVF